MNTSSTDRLQKVIPLFLYIHGSVNRESDLINIQQDATVFSLLHFCRQLYIFRVLSPNNCNYSFWHWSTGSTTIRSRCSVVRSRFRVPTQQRERFTSARSCNYSCWVSTPETYRAAYRNIIYWIQSHLVGQLLKKVTLFLCQSVPHILYNPGVITVFTRAHLSLSSTRSQFAFL